MIKSKLKTQRRESLRREGVDNAYRMPTNPAADNGRHARSILVDLLHLQASMDTTQQPFPLRHKKLDDGMRSRLDPIPMIPISGSFQKTETV